MAHPAKPSLRRGRAVHPAGTVWVLSHEHPNETGPG